MEVVLDRGFEEGLVNGLWQLTNKNNPNDYYVILNDGYVYNATTDTIVDNLDNYESKRN